MARIPRSAPSTDTPTLTGPARRIGRVTRPKRDSEEQQNALEMIDNHLKLIAINQNRIDYLRASIQPEIELIMAEIERLKRVLEGEIKQMKLDGYTDGVWEARFITAMGRASREIDAAKVQKLLSPTDFLKVIKVQVTELRNFMAEREIDSCSTITPAAPGATSFVVQPVEVKAAKRAKK